MSLRTWPSMYGDYEFNDNDEDEDTKANWEQVKLVIIKKTKIDTRGLFACNA